MSYSVILIDDPAPLVRRITLNRPEKRNPLGATMRAEILHALHAHDLDDDVRVTVIRGAGKCFSAGYDLGGGSVGEEPDYRSSEGAYPRSVTEGWMSIWDLAKPVIAQVHSYCLAGATELATGCDLVYVAEDAQIGYPAVRFGVPDMHFHAWLCGMRAAMEMMLTGDSISGEEAVALGWANRAFPADELDAAVVQVAERVAKIPTDIVQINKRTVRRAMDNMGMRASIRAGTELCGLAMHTEAFQDFLRERETSLTAALTKRDSPFGDYRTGSTNEN